MELFALAPKAYQELENYLCQRRVAIDTTRVKVDGERKGWKLIRVFHREGVGVALIEIEYSLMIALDREIVILLE